MSLERNRSRWWLPVTLMVVAAFAIGIGGGSLLAPIIGDLFGTPEETIPLETPNNVDQRADLIAGEGPAPQRPQAELQTPTGSTGLLEAPAQEAASTPEEDSRDLERRLLALDSPLTPPVTEMAERIRQAREDRRAARLPVSDNAATGADTGFGHEAGSAPLRKTNADQPGQAGIRATDIPQAAISPRTHLLARGAVIPAVLQSAIDSELPGLVRAQVSEDVYDSLTGAHILIPRGARLIGTYGQAGGSGKRRLFVTWSDLRLPDGTPIDLGTFSTLGADGASGLKGRRSTGFWQALGAAVLFDLAGNATAILTNQKAQPQSDIAALAGAALGNATSRVTSDYIGTLLESGPRFRIKAGSVMNVLVEQDLALPAARAAR